MLDPGAPSREYGCPTLSGAERSLRDNLVLYPLDTERSSNGYTEYEYMDQLETGVAAHIAETSIEASRGNRQMHGFARTENDQPNSSY